MTIQHNIQAMNANRQLNITGGNLAKSARNLSSGYKINGAADDAAGLSISEKMRKQIRGLTQATVNSEDGISMVQVADGAMAEVHDMLDRCIELSIQAANGTNSDSDRAKIQDEIDQIIKEIDGIQERTKFNEVYVLKGNYARKPAITGKEISNTGSLPLWVTSPSTTSIPAGQKSILSETFQNEYDYTYTTTTSTSAGIVTTTHTDSIKVNHSAASLDFSAIDSGADINDLAGMGFNTTCCTCNAYYSIEFVKGKGTGLVESETNYPTYVYKIGIDGITSAADLVKNIVDATTGTTAPLIPGNPGSHFTRLEADPKNPGKLWIYDNRSSDRKPTLPAGGKWDNWIGTGGGSTSYPEQYLWEMKPTPNSGEGLFGVGVMKEVNVYAEGELYRISEQLPLQVGADAGNQMHVRLATISSKALGIDNINVRGFVYENQERTDEFGIIHIAKVKRAKGADDAIKAFSAAKAMVSEDRSRLGACQNRLEHTVNNLDNIVENTTAAESRIRDTDMAKEMVRYSNLNIMQQAGQSMLAQSNQSRQGILSLLAA